jgi:geranylgeranyl pyrophosphate synthase
MARLDELRPVVEEALDELLPAVDSPPARLHEAMRYSVFAGGKRVRPLLVLLAGESLGLDPDPLAGVGVALELVHTYSLIHDDLPALDDDDLRRGRPTLHRQYDEATAILAGDALLTLGLTLLAEHPAGAPGEVRARAVAHVGRALGTAGMIGGQVADLEAERKWPADPAAALESIHRRKTGALLTLCLELPGLYGGVDADTGDLLTHLGHALGLLFQIADDILDVEESSETLGKTAGKDAAASKLTYPGLYGLAESKRLRDRVAQRARELAGRLPRPAGMTGFVELLASRRS